MTEPNMDVPKEIVTNHLKEDSKEKDALKVEKPRKVKFVTHSHSIYDPPIHFPQKLKKDKLEKKFSKFLNIIKKLHINILLIETLKQMPNDWLKSYTLNTILPCTKLASFPCFLFNFIYFCRKDFKRLN